MLVSWTYDKIDKIMRKVIGRSVIVCKKLDGILNRVLKECYAVLAIPLGCLFKLFHTWSVSKAVHTSVIPVHKRDSKSDPFLYRRKQDGCSLFRPMYRCTHHSISEYVKVKM